MALPIERSDPRSPAPNSPTAWRMAGSAFIAGFVIFGVVYSHGVFLQPMTDEFHLTRTEASAFCAIASLIWYLLGPVTGYLCDRFGPRGIVFIGAAAMGSGLITTAFTHNIWIAYLAYGFGVGLGAACAFVRTLANLGGWFVLQRNKAFGVAAAGTGCGMLILPPLSGWSCPVTGGWSFLLQFSVSHMGLESPWSQVY